MNYDKIPASFPGSKKKSEEHLLAYANLHQYSSYSVSYGGNELFVGRAGYLLGAIWLEKELQRPVLSVDTINEICRLIVDDGRAYAQAHQSASPLMYAYYDTEYIGMLINIRIIKTLCQKCNEWYFTGAAHGLSSILFVLLHCENYLLYNKEAEKDVKAATDYILSLQTNNGNFPCATEDIGFEMRSDEDYELVHWCHGAPGKFNIKLSVFFMFREINRSDFLGVVYLMAKAYLRWQEDKYLQSCIKCGEVIWEKGLLKKGPGNTII